jgi:hypothetical protein
MVSKLREKYECYTNIADMWQGRPIQHCRREPWSMTQLTWSAGSQLEVLTMCNLGLLLHGHGMLLDLEI